MQNRQLVYDIESDRDRIASIQSASQRGTGLKVTHGLVGSEEWWSQINKGSLTVQVCEGRIVAVDGGPMRDWPTMRIADKEDRIRAWTVRGTVDDADIGRMARVEYVEQEPVKPPRPDYRVDVVLRVWIER